MVRHRRPAVVLHRRETSRRCKIGQICVISPVDCHTKSVIQRRPMAYYIPPPVRFDLNEPRKIGNLAEKMEQDDRRKLADFLLQLVGIDEQSMNEWMTEADGYLKNLQGEAANQPQDDEQRGANESAEAPTTSLTLSAIIQFAAGATDALLGEP